MPKSFLFFRGFRSRGAFTTDWVEWSFARRLIWSTTFSSVGWRSRPSLKEAFFIVFRSFNPEFLCIWASGHFIFLTESRVHRLSSSFELSFSWSHSSWPSLNFVSYWMAEEALKWSHVLWSQLRTIQITLLSVCLIFVGLSLYYRVF